MCLYIGGTLLYGIHVLVFRINFVKIILCSTVVVIYTSSAFALSKQSVSKIDFIIPPKCGTNCKIVYSVIVK